jgi:hypothetical protein
MKTIRHLTLTATALLCTAFASAQTADEIIGKYVNALGDKGYINQITSVYMEGRMDAMGNPGTVKTTLVNGKGFKQEIDINGTSVVMCYTDSMGWQINPMTGNYSAENMPDNQYLSGKDQIYAGGPFMTDYQAKGYKVELEGQETVGSVNAYKLKVLSPDNMEAIYYFDPESYYLIRLVEKAEMMGQPMDIEMTFSNYQKPDNGYTMPYTMEINYGGQFFLVSNITKVEINKPVDLAVFAKP